MADKKSERDERLAKALRDNLKRRKAHPRERPETRPQDDRPTED